MSPVSHTFASETWRETVQVIPEQNRIVATSGPRACHSDIMVNSVIRWRLYPLNNCILLLQVEQQIYDYMYIHKRSLCSVHVHGWKEVLIFIGFKTWWNFCKASETFACFSFLANFKKLSARVLKWCDCGFHDIVQTDSFQENRHMFNKRILLKFNHHPWPSIVWYRYTYMTHLHLKLDFYIKIFRFQLYQSHWTSVMVHLKEPGRKLQ